MEEKQRAFASGINFYKVFWIFLIFCVAGDLAEVVFCRFSMGRWMSRSSLLYGPFSIVWGLGGAMFTVFLKGLSQKRDLYIFLTGTALGGAYEYLCGLFSEQLFSVRFWDYSRHSFNFQGRVNLLFCFFWGLVALLWVKDFYPRLSRQIERIPGRVGRPLTVGLALFMAVNITLSGVALVRYGERQYQVSGDSRLDTFLDAHYPDNWMEKRYSNMKKLKTEEDGKR